MTTFITFILSNFTLTFLILGLIISIARLSLSRNHDISTIIEDLLTNYIFWAIGISFFYNFVMHVFFADMAAQFIGWRNSPFQYEVGYASLGFSVVAILAHRSTYEFRIAAILGPSLFMWGAAIGHIYQIIVFHNNAPGNAGIMLWTDILIPIIGFLLLSLSRRHPKATGKE
jgi:hypothetical protein